MAEGYMEAPASNVHLGPPDLRDPLGSIEFVKGTDYMHALSALGYNVENMTSPIPLMTKIAQAGSSLLDMGRNNQLEYQKAQADLAYKTAQARYTDSEAANNETLLGSRLKLLQNQADEAATNAKIASSTADDQIAISGIRRQSDALKLQQQKDGIEKGNAAQTKWESEYKNFPSGLNNPDYPAQRDKWIEENGDLVMNPATKDDVAKWIATQNEIYGRQADTQINGAMTGEIIKAQEEGNLPLHLPKPLEQMSSDEKHDLIIKKNLKVALGQMRSALSTLPEVPQQLGQQDTASPEEVALRARLINASTQLESYLGSDDSLALIKSGRMPNINANGVETDDFARALSDYQAYRTRAAAAQAVTNPEVTIKTIPAKGKEGEGIEFKMPFDEAFRRGLIDAQGRQIKAPTAQPMNEEEKAFRNQQATNAIRAEPGNEGVRKVAEAYAKGEISTDQFAQQLRLFKRAQPAQAPTPEYVGIGGGQFGGLVTPGGINGPQAGLGRARGGLIPPAAVAGYGQGFDTGGVVTGRLPGTELDFPRQAQNAARADMLLRPGDPNAPYLGTGSDVRREAKDLIDWRNFSFGPTNAFSEGSGFYNNSATGKPYDLSDQSLVGVRVPMNELTRVLGTDAGSEKSPTSADISRGAYRAVVTKRDGTLAIMPIVDVTPEGKNRGLELTPAAMKMMGIKPGEELGYKLAFPDGSGIEPTFGGRSPIHDWLNLREQVRRPAAPTQGYQQGGLVNPELTHKGGYPVGKEFKGAISDEPGRLEANALWNINEVRWLDWELQARAKINQHYESPDYDTRMNATQANYALNNLNQYRNELKTSWEKNPFDPKQTATLDQMRKEINDSIGLIHEPFYPMPVSRTLPSDVTAAKGYQDGGPVSPLLGENADVAPSLTLGSTDTVSAMLTPGEFVLNAGAVKDIGLPMLEALNQSPSSAEAQSDVTNVATPLLLGEAGQAPSQMGAPAPMALPPVAQPGSAEWPHLEWSLPVRSQAPAPRAELAAPAPAPAVTTGPATFDINKPLAITGQPIGGEMTGLATNFGHDVQGRPDTYMLSRLGPGSRIGAFGTDVVNPNTVGASLPSATIRANIGDPTNPAVRRAIQSGRYQVRVQAPNGRSGQFRIVDIGPGPNEPGKIDLTGSAMRELGVTDSFNARFQIVDTQATQTYQTGGLVAQQPSNFGTMPPLRPYSDRRTAVQSLM
jgi:hypothetical protein